MPATPRATLLAPPSLTVAAVERAIEECLEGVPPRVVQRCDDDAARDLRPVAHVCHVARGHAHVARRRLVLDREAYLVVREGPVEGRVSRRPIDNHGHDVVAHGGDAVVPEPPRALDVDRAVLGARGGIDVLQEPVCVFRIHDGPVALEKGQRDWWGWAAEERLCSAGTRTSFPAYRPLLPTVHSRSMLL